MREHEIYDREKVLGYGGKALLDRIAAKDRGALSNREGRDFELVFAVYRIAQIGAEILEDPIRSKRPDESDVTEFVSCLVDDLRTRNGAEVIYYQLKSGRVRKRGLLEDFRDQKKLDEIHEIDCSYHLVVDTARRRKAALRWICEQNLPVECYVFASSKHYLQMEQKNPEFRDWLFSISGSRNVAVLHTCYELMLARWLRDGDCNVKEFFWTLAKENRIFYPRLFRNAITEYENFAENIADVGFESHYENRCLRIYSAGTVILQFDYCTDAFFDCYNRWHSEQETLSQLLIAQKLTLEGAKC